MTVQLLLTRDVLTEQTGIHGLEYFTSKISEHMFTLPREDAEQGGFIEEFDSLFETLGLLAETDQDSGGQLYLTLGNEFVATSDNELKELMSATGKILTDYAQADHEPKKYSQSFPCSSVGDLGGKKGCPGIADIMLTLDQILFLATRKNQSSPSYLHLLLKGMIPEEGIILPSGNSKIVTQSFYLKFSN